MNAGPVVNPMSEYDVDAELLAQMREDFLPEAQDILDRLGTVLALLESAPSADAIQEIFRLVHTLKGTASFVGLESFRLLAHKLEDLFGAVRSGQLVVSAELMDLAFEAVHTLAALRQDLARGGSGESDVQPLAARLEEAASGRSAPSPTEIRPATGPAPEANTPTRTSVAPAAGATRPRAVLAEESGDTLRVDVEVMDNLMVLVGELITNRNALLSIAERVGDGPLLETSSAISRLTRQLQNTVTTARLTPVDRLFSRFIPVVRNLARDCGKKARLVVEGGDVPLDRAVSDEMHDPLVHLLRNAVDHGLELPEERRRLGKPVEGLVHLSAVRRGDDVTLRLSDDGAGIDLDAVRRRAVERGLLSEAEAADVAGRSGAAAHLPVRLQHDGSHHRRIRPRGRPRRSDRSSPPDARKRRCRDRTRAWNYIRHPAAAHPGHIERAAGPHRRSHLFAPHAHSPRNDAGRPG